MHEKRYTRLKLKMLLLVLTGAVVVCALSLFLVEVVVDGFLQDPVSRLFVWVATNLFGQSTEVALDAYETYIRANKSEILSLGLVVLMLLAFYVAMGRFTTWLEEIRWATHSLADTAEEEIRLPRELQPLEQDLNAIETTLTSNTNGETTYEVQAGDTFMALAFENDMTMSELEALNPGIDINKLMIGQVLNMKEEIPFLSVETVDHVTYTESVAAPVREVEDSSMYEGDTRVVSAGSAGTQQVTADVTYLNGKETGREVVETTVLTQPTERVIAVGTKERPSWIATGSFQWPVYGNITSYYGYRSIFGSYSLHRGLDIACSYGTGISAADGGTVTFAGWSGTYGYLVTIDHGNGFVTYYAHNSSLLVSAGDKVYKGQTIARAGSTGRSTGTHCHFEVHRNGSLVNPLNYLP